ncbi:hypothetical protein JCM19235_427 [Vibrio maritimus]|uniref:Uncharacterized protein n=1 Tax=Vibrio maritimus TaxID=990268 RepID=A0A090SP29_9VIBR|nr:hypothetical protein JCM19235_427 [Vibrio maritimus]
MDTLQQTLIESRIPDFAANLGQANNCQLEQGFVFDIPARFQSA